MTTSIKNKKQHQIAPDNPTSDIISWIVLSCGLLLTFYLLVQWMNNPHNDTYFIPVAWPTLHEMKQNFSMALSGYRGGYLRSLWAYGILTLMTLSFISVGNLILSRRLFRNLSADILRSEKTGLSFLIGSLAFSLLWLLFGLLGLLNFAIALTVMILGAAFFIIQTLKSGTYSGPPIPKSDKIFWCSLAGFFLIRSIMTVQHQTYSDTYLTHLSLPNLYIQHGHMMGSIFNVYTYFPQNTEMLVMWCLLLKSEMAAALLMISFFAAMTAVAWGFLRRNASNWGAMAETLLLFSVPPVMWFSGTIKNDFPSGVFLFAHFCALKEAIDHQDQQPDIAYSWVLLAGLFCGGAMGHKFTAIISFAATFIVLSWISIRAREFKLIGIFSAGFFVAIAPWLLRSLFLTGDPIYPYMTSLLGLKMAAPWHSTDMISASTEKLGIQGLTEYFRLLFGLSFQNGIIQPTTWGPAIILVAASIGALFTNLSNGLKISIVSALAGWLLHLCYSTEIRYHMGFVAYLAGIPFFILIKDCTKPLRAMTLIFVFVTFTVGLTSMSFYNLLRPAVANFISGFSKDNYSIEYTDRQAYNMSWMSHLINTRTKPSDGVLLAGVLYSYGIERKMYFSNDRDKQMIIAMAEESSDVQGLKEKLQKLGIAHILLSRDFFEAYSNLSNDRLNLKPKDAVKIAQLFQQNAKIRFATSDGQMAWLTLTEAESELSPVVLDSQDAMIHPIGYLSAVMGQYNEKNYVLALSLLEKAENVPMNRFNRANVVLYRGAIEVLSGQPEKGFENMEKAINIAPDLYSSYITLSRFYIANNYRTERVPEMLKIVVSKGGYRDIVSDPIFTPYMKAVNQ